MDVISIEPKQVSMMVGTEVAPPYCKPCTRRPPSSLSARRTTMRDDEMVFGAEVLGVRPSLVLAYDGWNQAAAKETCQTLRAVASEGEANDAVVKVCVIW